MNSYEEDLKYERKMDRISEQIEELMLDAMIKVSGSEPNNIRLEIGGRDPFRTIFSNFRNTDLN